ncbi:MAG: hypothetical protein H7833_20405 [Magnetococcus sp. DMHC-1]|nr:hypothetical protein [Magnetococcales bacterium]
MNATDADRYYREVIEIMKSQCDVYASMHPDKNFLNTYLTILNFLQNYSLKDLDTLLKKSASVRDLQKSFNISEPEISTLSCDEIKSIVKRQDIPKKILEKIASERFFVPIGSVKSCNKTQLIEKILNQVENEQIHSTIASVAGRSDFIRKQQTMEDVRLSSRDKDEVS